MKNILEKLIEHQTLTKEEAYTSLKRLISGETPAEQIAAFTTVFLMRSITVDEIYGFRRALLDLSRNVDLPNEVVDIVGTGGDGKNSFNISTTTAFVVAGAGYKVVKHGNVSVTSPSGSSDLFSSLGVKFNTEKSINQKSLERANIAFLHAPLFNEGMKRVAPVRNALAVRTLFNILGPLISPIQPKHQLLGVYSLALFKLYTYSYQHTATNFCVVHSLDGYDEISLTSSFITSTPKGERIYAPEELGMHQIDPLALSIQSKEDAKEIFLKVLKGEATQEQESAVLANAAFAIRLFENKKEIEDCLSIARESIKSGAAYRNLKQFITLNT